jgi:hypothetical protein
MATPYDTIRESNPHALWARENNREIFVEDVTDPDGRMYRLEIRCDADGRNAEAYCLHNPWGRNTYSVSESHIFDSGLLCLGPHGRAISFKDAVARARYWATAYSCLRETGRFPQPVTP